MGKVSMVDGHIDEEKGDRRGCKYCGSSIRYGTYCPTCSQKLKLTRQIKQMLNDAKSEVDTK